MTDETSHAGNGIGANDFLTFMADLKIASQAKDSSVAKIRSIYARFDKLGGDKDAIKLALGLLRKDPVEAEMMLKTALRYVQWSLLRQGEQGSLFAADITNQPSEKARAAWTEAQAQEEGFLAGKAGRAASDHRFVAGTPVHEAFYVGWCAGQTTLAEVLGVKRPKTGEALKPEKKAKGTPARKKGSAKVSAAKPRGRRPAVEEALPN